MLTKFVQKLFWKRIKKEKEKTNKQILTNSSYTQINNTIIFVTLEYVSYLDISIRTNKAKTHFHTSDQNKKKGNYNQHTHKKKQTILNVIL